jgi:hypothetical protein
VPVTKKRCGHFALDEAPDLVADLTGNFLDETTGGESSRV